MEYCLAGLRRLLLAPSLRAGSWLPSPEKMLSQRNKREKCGLQHFGHSGSCSTGNKRISYLRKKVRSKAYWILVFAALKPIPRPLFLSFPLAAVLITWPHGSVSVKGTPMRTAPRVTSRWRIFPRQGASVSRWPKRLPQFG